MSYGRRYRRKTPPRLRLRRPRPYIQPHPKGAPLSSRERVVWWSICAALIVGGILFIALTR